MERTSNATLTPPVRWVLQTLIQDGLADACVAINNAQQSGGGAEGARRNGVWHSPSQPMGVVQVQDHAMLTKIYQDARSPFGMDTSDRRNVESNSIKWADTRLK